MHMHSSEVFIEFVLYFLCSSFHFIFLMCAFFLIGTTWLFKMTSNRRVCVNRPDNFCYICGQYTPKQQCKNITKSIQLAYKYYFDCKLGDQDKEWAPHVCCVPYNSMLSVWMNGKSYMKFSLFYSQEENACFCNDISGLMQEIDCCYDPSKWRLFIDSSKASLKAVLLHNGNEKPLIPVAHATGLNGTYEFMDFLLRLTKYKEHTWNICGDLKVVPLLLGLFWAFCVYGTAEMTKTTIKELIGHLELNTFLVNTM